MVMEEEEDLYAVLRLDDAGPHIVHALIRKAYRKRALELHPDKRGDDPVAAAEFQKLQQAYDILNDEKARASYDELQRVRKERVQSQSRQSEKRQKMMRDLAEKEKAHEREQKVKSQEEDVQRRLKAEIARITKARGRQFKGPPSFDQGISAGVDARQQYNESPPFDLGKSAKVEVPPQSSGEASDAERTLKVSWTCLDGGAGDYSASRLKEVFEEFGVVEDLVVRSGKSRKKRSALIVMATQQAAVTATENVCGDYWNPLLVVPLLPGTSGVLSDAWSIEKWVSKLIKKQHLLTIICVSWHPNSVLFVTTSTVSKYPMLSAFIRGVDARSTDVLLLLYLIGLPIREDSMKAFNGVECEELLQLDIACA